MTVHAMPDPAAVDQRRGGRLRMLLLFLVCVAPVVASYFMYFVVRPDGAGAAYGTIIDPPREEAAVAIAQEYHRVAPNSRRPARGDDRG